MFAAVSFDTSLLLRVALQLQRRALQRHARDNTVRCLLCLAAVSPKTPGRALNSKQLAP
jgi:hypothetical protein